MAITIYQQSKAFVFLSRFNLVRFSVTSGTCVAGYILGKGLCSRDSPKARTYGEISQHYSKFCGTILWGHVMVTCGGALFYAARKSLPRAVYLQKGFVFGEQMGFGTLITYILAREASSREWFAMGTAGGYSGLKYSLIQKLNGWPAYQSTRIGIWAGLGTFVAFSFWQCLVEIWGIFTDPNLTYSAWDNFDLELYFEHRISRFFNITAISDWVQANAVVDRIAQARTEMDELEGMARQAGLTASDYLYVNPEKISETIFEVIDSHKTGRPEYDDERPTTTTVAETKFRQFDPAYDARNRLSFKSPG